MGTEIIDTRHLPGQLDWGIIERSFSATEFRRKPSVLWTYLEVAGHVAFITRRGKRVCTMMSVETYACLSGDYEKTLNSIDREAAAWRAERRAKRRARGKERSHDPDRNQSVPENIGRAAVCDAWNH